MNFAYILLLVNNSQFQLLGDLKIMDWPAQSPDLNVLEPFWDLLDSKLAKMRPTSQEELWRQLETQWRKISIEECRKYIDSMPARCRAVIEAKGDHTKY